MTGFSDTGGHRAMHVCFASFEGFEGCVQSCRNAAAVLGGDWALIPRAGEPPAAVLDAGVLVLSSWHDRYEPILTRREGPVVPRWHSALVQSDLAEEQAKIVRILDLLDRRSVRVVVVDDREVALALGRDDVVFLPDVLDESDYRAVEPAPLRGVHVSLFGAAEGRKNIMGQSAAFERARRAAGGPAWTLHLNGQSFSDRGYGRWLDAARIPCVDHGWLRRAEYLSLVAAMNAGLCATLSESYCYGAADHVALGVPIVASPAIACLGDDEPRARPDHVDDIAQALGAALVRGADIAAGQHRALWHKPVPMPRSRGLHSIASRPNSREVLARAAPFPGAGRTTVRRAGSPGAPRRSRSPAGVVRSTWARSCASASSRKSPGLGARSS